MNNAITDFQVDWIDPHALLTPQRFDIAAKYLYARLREKNVQSDWGRFVYNYHLMIWNGFYEDFPRKVNERDFLESFHRVIDNTRQTSEPGLRSLIPLARDGSPLNGAHRIAAALLLEKMVACVKTELPSVHINYNHRFFKACAASTGHIPNTDVFDTMALEFCRLLPNIAIAVKFPAAKSSTQEIERILSEHGAIFYKKPVTLKNEGPLHLIRELYEDKPRIDTAKNDIDDLRQKVSRCFNRRGPVHFYLLAFDNQEGATKAKTLFEDLFGISNDFIHIADNRDKAWAAARFAFSNASIHFANLRQQRETPHFSRLLSAYRGALAGAEDAEDFCIEGDAVMAAYGIRDCDKIDYISHGGRPLDMDAHCNNDLGKHYAEKTLDDIIFHHCNHFYFKSIKFATLENVRDWKRARGEPQDHADIALINALLSKRPLAQAGAKAQLAVQRFGYSFIPALSKNIKGLKKKLRDCLADIFV